LKTHLKYRIYNVRAGFYYFHGHAQLDSVCYSKMFYRGSVYLKKQGQAFEPGIVAACHSVKFTGNNEMTYSDDILKLDLVETDFIVLEPDVLQLEIDGLSDATL
jgi:hypothetical protein